MTNGYPLDGAATSVHDGVAVSRTANVAEVTLDRPPVNAVSERLYQSLIDVFAALSINSDVDVIILRSANERVFCAGVEMREVQAQVTSGTDSMLIAQQALARQCYEAILTCAQPSIAVLNGPALGAGAVLAACCDIRYASRSATIGLPEINVGRCGGGRHLMRFAPSAVVREMYFTGGPLTAEEALQYGLVNATFEAGTELAAARELAMRIAAKSPVSLRIAKEALNAAEWLPVSEGYALEQTYTLRLARTPDGVEAARAFLEKRDPIWERSSSL